MKFDPAVSTPIGLVAAAGPEPVRPPADVAAAGLIHDLGNLIQLASSAISVLGRGPDVEGADPGSVIASAKASLEQAGALVRQALGRVREVSADDRMASLAESLSEIEATMRSAGHAGLELDIRLTPGLPDVACDPLALKSALLNLLFNARDAMAGKGVIEVTGEVIGAGLVELRIADHGIGMSRETVARALDPFFTTKCDGLGGIGLPMVERFARAAGGELTLESEPGAGTTATLRLPVAGKGMT